MKLRYQRELYRALLCWDTGKEEADLGYPLQMCLRNSIPGLLSCHGQTVDGKFCLCWDVTSRHSLSQAVGETSLPVRLLVQVLKTLQNTMEAMENYLIPCGYLALSPEWIFLDVRREEISFLCEFGQESSFHDTLQVFGEFVLAHMDHQDPAAMRLGYGLYRLAVEDTFDRREFARLLDQAQEQFQGRSHLRMEDRMQSETEWPRDDGNSFEGKMLSAGQRSFFDHATGIEGEKTEAAQKLTNEQRLRQETLNSFFSDDEDVSVSVLPPGKIILLCGIAVLLGLLIMEGIVYFRNGHHLAWWWLAAGGVLFAISAAAFVMLEVLGQWKNRENDKKGNRKSSALGTSISKSGVREVNRCGVQQYPVFEKNEIFSERQSNNTHTREQMENFNTQQTVLLNTWPYRSEETEVYLQCEDGKRVPLKGEHWLIGKQRGQVDICLEKDTVSRLHARIYRKADEYYLEDLNSRNGTKLEGQMIDSGHAEMLNNGAKICFADYECTFVR